MALSVQNRKTQAAADLRAQVLTCALAPGADLDETQLCARFGLSRTPMRDVFRDLSGEGYLSHRANRGVQVAALSHTTLRAFFQAAPMIYGAVLQLAAQCATQAQIAALKSSQDDFRAALASGSTAERALANNRFHDVTGDMAQNPYLQPSFQRLLIDHARISMTFYQPDTGDVATRQQLACAQHDAIISAIEARDATVAGQLALDHWELSRAQIESFVMPVGLDAQLGTVMMKETA